MHALIQQQAIPTSQKHVHLIVAPILVLIFQLFLSSFVCDQNIFFLKSPIQKFMHHFDFFSGIWSNPLYTCKHTYERYKFHIEPLTVSYSTPPSLKGEHSLNMAVLSKTYKYILYNQQSFKSRQHSSLVSIEIPSITISLFSIFVNTSVNSQQIFRFIWVGLFQLCGICQQMGRQIQHSQIQCQSFAGDAKLAN